MLLAQCPKKDGEHRKKSFTIPADNEYVVEDTRETSMSELIRRIVQMNYRRTIKNGGVERLGLQFPLASDLCDSNGRGFNIQCDTKLI